MAKNEFVVKFKTGRRTYTYLTAAGGRSGNVSNAARFSLVGSALNHMGAYITRHYLDREVSHVEVIRVPKE